MKSKDSPLRKSSNGSKQTFRAWVVFWTIGENKVNKSTGTVVTLLPYRFGIDTVRIIVEALYAAYALPFSRQEDYVRHLGKKQSISRRTFDGKVSIDKNPGLMAVLATDVRIEVDSSGLNQIISWTNPDTLEPSNEEPYFKTVSTGARRKFRFNYHTLEQERL